MTEQAAEKVLKFAARGRAALEGRVSRLKSAGLQPPWSSFSDESDFFRSLFSPAAKKRKPAGFSLCGVGFLGAKVLLKPVLVTEFPDHCCP